jgi:propionyl-CoA synthetase
MNQLCLHINNAISRHILKPSTTSMFMRTKILRRGYMLSALEYDNMHSESVHNKERFWIDYALKNVKWIKEPTVALDSSSPPFYKWFPDGTVNMCENAVDQHVGKGNGDNVAIAFESNVGGNTRTITYDELLMNVSKFAMALHKSGIGKGDRVIIYMPMVPEALFAMLACTRIGAVHSVVFGGFAANELAVRIDDATPKAVITSSCGVERNNVLPYLPILKESFDIAKHTPEAIFVHQRDEIAKSSLPHDEFSKLNTTLYDFYDELENSSSIECQPLNANDPLYILYTSGTTGQPKGVLRDNTHVVPLKWTMDNFMNTKEGEVYWAGSDIGWVVGHSYICYAPLIQGCTTVMYEGKPVGTPDAGAFWKIIEKHKVNTFFTAPTALRAIRKEDPNAELIKNKYDVSSLERFFLAGERCDPDTMNFYTDVFKTYNCQLVDHWWQTETGYPIAGFQNDTVGMKPGSTSRPLPTYDLQVLDPFTGEVINEPNKEGSLACKLPLPPGTMVSLYNNDKRFVESYFTEFGNEWYSTGDAGYRDEDNYFHIMARTDDVINVAGHRLSTGALEEAVSNHPDVVECAVMGVEDELKGHIPVGLIVVSGENDREEEEICQEVVQFVRDRVGAVAAFKSVAVVSALPKTRSGKILRNVMRNIADGKEYKLPGTIEDASVIDKVKASLKGIGYGN